MSDKGQEPTGLGDEEHDAAALAEADRRMLLREPEDLEGSAGQDARPDPGSAANEEHGEQALEEGAERMLLRRDPD